VPLFTNRLILACEASLIRTLLRETFYFRDMPIETNMMRRKDARLLRKQPTWRVGKEPRCNLWRIHSLNVSRLLDSHTCHFCGLENTLRCYGYYENTWRLRTRCHGANAFLKAEIWGNTEQNFNPIGKITNSPSVLSLKRIFLRFLLWCTFESYKTQHSAHKSAFVCFVWLLQ
jgi:hypothetical protein